MSKFNLGTNDLEIRLHDSPQEAPSYTLPDYKAVNLTTAVVVGMGTKSGKPTVDFVFEDENGQKYVAMLTGGLVQNLAGAVQGMQQRTSRGNDSE